MINNIVDLPDDVLIHLFNNYLQIGDLFSAAEACSRFALICNEFCATRCHELPTIDFNYPCGFNDYFKYSNGSSSRYDTITKLRTYFNLKSQRTRVKTFYRYKEKMIPRMQVDDSYSDYSKDGSLGIYVTNAGQLDLLSLADIDKFVPKIETNRHNKLHVFPDDSVSPIISVNVFDNQDIRDFKKKDDLVVCFSENKIKIHQISYESQQVKLLNEIEEARSLSVKINCIDFDRVNSLLVYGLSDGLVKVVNMNSEFKQSNATLTSTNVGDRLLRCVFSPSYKNLALGTAGIKPCPIKIYDLEPLKEIQVLLPAIGGSYKLGAGVLALSYIDENTVMSAGYDTFIRIFDLRSNKCVQSLEEPEDMSIYSVCCSSSSYGLVSGNDRQSLIRYWDRRQCKILMSFKASPYNSSIYSMATTPETIYAAWERGVTSIDFKK